MHISITDLFVSSIGQLVIDLLSAELPSGADLPYCGDKPSWCSWVSVPAKLCWVQSCCFGAESQPASATHNLSSISYVSRQKTRTSAVQWVGGSCISRWRNSGKKISFFAVRQVQTIRKEKMDYKGKTKNKLFHY